MEFEVHGLYSPFLHSWGWRNPLWATVKVLTLDWASSDATLAETNWGTSLVLGGYWNSGFLFSVFWYFMCGDLLLVKKIQSQATISSSLTPLCRGYWETCQECNERANLGSPFGFSWYRWGFYHRLVFCLFVCFFTLWCVTGIEWILSNNFVFPGPLRK